MTVYVQDADFTLHHGDCVEVLRSLPEASVHCCVTSPPYWGLRDYGTGTWEGGHADCDHTTSTVATQNLDKFSERHYRGGGHKASSEGAVVAQFRDVCGKCGAGRVDQQLGLEQTPDEYVARMVDVFREVRRVLRDDGSLWLNLGDSYAGAASGEGANTRGGLMALNERLDGRKRHSRSDETRSALYANRPLAAGSKPKDLVGIPWMVAFALRADGWYLRSDIIWSKPNPMPESVTDRPTKAHEYVFLLTKSPRYFFDQEAVREKAVGPDRGPGMTRGVNGPHAEQAGLDRRERRTAAITPARRTPLIPEQTKQGVGTQGNGSETFGHYTADGGRNVRSVWEIATQPYAEAHFATFPLELPRRCIKAGSPTGGTVLDPFMGSGTTALVARELERQSVGIELNADYCALAAKRLSQLSLLAI